MAIIVRVTSALSISDELCTLEALPTWRVRDLKAEIAEFLGTAPREQRLSVAGKLLRDRETLGYALRDAPFQGGGEEPVLFVVSLVRVDPVWAEVAERLESGLVRLKDLAPEHRADSELALTALRRRGPPALLEAADELRENRSFILKAVQACGAALEHAPDEFREDCEVVLAAVGNHSKALAYAAGVMRTDREFVLQVMKVNGYALEHVHQRLQGNREVVLAAVENSGLAFQFAAEALRRDHFFVLEVVRLNGLALAHVAFEVTCRKVVLAAVESGKPRAISFAPMQHQLDREVVLAAVTANGEALAYCEEKFLYDREVVKVAMSNSPDALSHAAPELQEDQEMLALQEMFLDQLLDEVADDDTTDMAQARPYLEWR